MNHGNPAGHTARAYNMQTVRLTGVAALLFLFALVRVFRPMSDWAYTQWLFSYQYGFVKRGLHGEILHRLGADGSYILIVSLSVLILAGISVLLFRLFLILLTGNQNLPEGGRTLLSSSIQLNVWLFFLLAIFHSATFQMLYFNIGRLEHIHLFLTLACLLLMVHGTDRGSEKRAGTGSSRKRPVLFLAVTFTVVVSLLVHEAFYFFFLPVLFMAWIYTDRGTLFYNIMRAALFAGASILTWYIAVYGLMDMDQYYPYMEAMREQYGSRALYSSLMVVFRDTAMNLDYTQYWLLKSPRIPVYIFFFLMIMSPGAIFFWKLYRRDFQYSLKALKRLFTSRRITSSESEPLLRAAVILSCLSPLCLIPLGFDIFRWFGITFLNLFMMTALLSVNSSFRTHLYATTNRYWYMAALAIGLSFLIGGLDASYSFSSSIHAAEWGKIILRFISS